MNGMGSLGLLWAWQPDCIPREKMASSGPTLDVGMVDEDEEEIDGELDVPEAWGRLYPLGKGLKGVGKYYSRCKIFAIF